MGEFKIPSRPSERLMAKIKELPIWTQNAIIYTVGSYRDPITGIQHKAVKCTCTGCGKSWYEQHYSMSSGCSAAYNTAPAPYGIWDASHGEVRGHGDVYRCEECGEMSTLLWAGTMRPYRVQRETVVTELRNVDGRACVISFAVRELFHKEGRKEMEVLPWEAYDINGGKISRWSGHQKNMGGSEIYYGVFRRRERYSDELGCGPLLFAPKGVFDGTEAENSRADIMAGRDTWIVSYLHKWLKTPVLEAIAATGGAALIADMLNSNVVQKSYYGKYGMAGGPLPGILNKKEKRPAQALGLTKEEYRACIEDKWSWKALQLFQTAKTKGIRWSRDDVRAIMKLGDNSTGRAFEMWPEETVRIVRYMLKQIEKKTGASHLLTISEYIDYRKALADNGEDTRENWYPRRIVSAHDTAVEKRRLKKDREKDIKIAERAEKLAALIWERDGIIIRPARSTGELIAEGKALSHCVGGYGESVSKGEKNIFFMRHADAPEVSWYTLELKESDLTVVQNHTKRNALQTPEVKAWENAWIEHIKKDLVREPDGTWRIRKEKKQDGDKNAERAAS